MASRLQRRMALRRKLHILRTLTKSKSVKKSSIIMDAFVYIYKLKLQVEAIKREYQYLVNHIQEVKVEEVNDDKEGRRGLLMVRVKCKKGEELLMRMVEVFEKMTVNVVEARVTTSCDDHFFRMEAIVQANVDAAILNQAILNLIQTQNDEISY
ncbi:hypothetical protein Salat_2064700 [Sesamum alatum]|uniref:Plant bHLH transcription factor ACT-like domain-containing protein n=1 Tax=Sesamum alatum TaxID=300844 RepID=A0AAE2CGF3_9LAMI|nr:hypothetical protein Salat_2064700 [Sesamum alatum]